jgi:group II intron reverse transcriptase/maturase
MNDRSLGNLWDYTNWRDCEAKVSAMQRRIALAAIRRDDCGRIEAQKDLVCSVDAKMLAVRHVSDNMNTPGIDGVRWLTSAEKMKAALSLTSKGYDAKPMRQFILQQKGSNKERRVQIPTAYDRAMQVLYAMSLDAVSESAADKKSFAFRKGRSQLDAHAYIVAALRGSDPPRFIVMSDVESFYGQISHDWLLANIPMDAKVLRRFLTAGHVFNGELFPREDIGIPLGGNISAILANMVLDGLQAEIFAALRGDGCGATDYADGNLIRFADDIIVTARTLESARRILDAIKAFLVPRGLRLNDGKTRIIPLGEDFTFLSRTYRYVDGVVCVSPSDAAVAKFSESLRELILPWRGSQKGLIDRLNKTLTGWATYHKVSDARDTFRNIDIAVKALLLQLCERLNPVAPRKKLIERYFFLDHTGARVYALPDKPEVRVVSLSETILTDYRPVRVGFNPYLDAERRETREDARLLGMSRESTNPFGNGRRASATTAANQSFPTTRKLLWP